MNIAEIKKLPMREKFQIMEALWQDLSSDVENADIPAEHKAILDKRFEQAESGEMKFLDWDKVKNTLGRA